MATYVTAKRTIKLPFPTREYEQYKKQAGATDGENLTEDQINKIFALTVDAFLRGDISTDDIASICNTMFDRVVKVKGKEESELLHAIIAGSELGFYIRSPNMLAKFNRFLQDVLNYREKIF